MGGSTNVRFAEFSTLQPTANQDLTPFLPGTAIQKGSTNSFSVVGLTCCDRLGDGRLILMGEGSGWYACTWDPNQKWASGDLAFTTTGAATIPAGFVVWDGGSPAHDSM